MATVVKQKGPIDETEQPFARSDGIVSVLGQATRMTWNINSSVAAASNVAELAADADLATVRSTVMQMLNEDIALGRRKKES